jgi:hypothetical protein
MKQEHLAKLKESFAHLSALEAERTRLMAVLQMWGEVVAQGINSDDIKSFGFSLQFVKKERFDKEPWYGKWVGNTRTCPEWYNYVTLKDGTKVPLEVYVKAPPTKGTNSGQLDLY